MPRFYIASPVDSLTTSFVKAVMIDDEGTKIKGSTVNLAKLTLIKKSNGAVVNGVSNIDVLNTSRGSWDESGKLKVEIRSVDNIVTVAGVEEVHVAKISYTYNITSVGRLEVEFTVRDL